MTEPKKLIEVAMPVKEVSAESVRDKSIRHGHISTLHLWWARRPLPVCRAVVFASLVPDPLDENCPQPFKQAVAKFLAGKEYKPYDDIPHTAAIDPMEDNLRNRLLMFIGKFSDDYIANEKAGKNTDSKKQLSDHSLIKWENKNNPKVIGTARKLIFIAHQTDQNSSAKGFSPSGEMSKGQRGLVELEDKYNQLWNAILTAENELYKTPNRHIETPEIKAKEQALHEAIENYLDHMPRVFDPFAGGGAIPLEAARLGCRTFGNDLNPVAHIIQRGSVEFPQKYGKPITYTRDEFLKQYPVFAEKPKMQVSVNYTFQHSIDTIELEGYDDAISKHSNIQDSRFILIKNRLAFDVEYYARQMLTEAEKEIGYLYPHDEQGNSLFVNIWCRIGRCSNPSCGAKVPLLKQFFLSNPRSSGSNLSRKLFLKPIINEKEIRFEILKGEPKIESWIKRGNLNCPCCGGITDVNSLKAQFLNGEIEEKILVKIYEDTLKGYQFVINEKDETFDEFVEIPNEKMQPNSAGGDILGWGFTEWGKLFNTRQLKTLYTIIKQLDNLKKVNSNESEYSKAIIAYLSLLIDRIATRGTSFGKWHILQSTVEHLFGRQAIQMNFDYPEINPFSNSSGGALGQLDWIIKYIVSESTIPFATSLFNSSSGEVNQFSPKFLDSVITDPPYYDAIAYADISDFFYVWLKRTLNDIYPFNFATPQTPKAEECTALKHHHHGNLEKAKKHFEDKLQQIFTSIEKQTVGLVSIMFAHQSTEAWTTLCNSILNANMNITGSWSNDTEITGALKTDKAFLTSSVTVACRPNTQAGYISFKAVRKNIEERVKKEVKLLYEYGFRGADLLTACFGQAVSEFGQYQTVEKADGTPVSVAELLELAREAAFNAIISDIDTDEVTKFYIGWLNLFGFTETEHDDVMRITQMGLSVETAELHQNHVFETSGNKESLSGYKIRCQSNQKLGTQANSFAIDKLHKAMQLYESGNRGVLIEYLGQVAPTADASFWRIGTALAEVLPNGCDDHRQLTGLLTNKESLIHEAQRRKQETPEQGKLEI